MAKVRVKCPACNTELEIDSEFVGQEVECGNCLEVFVANPPASGKKSGDSSKAGKSGSGSKAGSSSRGKSRDNDEEDRPRKRSRRRDDDDDDYEHDRRRRRDDDEDDEDYYSPPPRRGGGGNGLGVTSLVLGILAVLPGCFCICAGPPLGVAAAVTGGIALSNPQAKGMGIAGLILGICGFIFSVIVFLVTGL
jgi:predicted Zn finger-like uncharacterized protein